MSKSLHILSILLVFAHTTILSQTKPKPFEIEHITWNGTSYAFIREIKPNMIAARSACEKLKMELVKIDSKEENDFLTKTAFAKDGVTTSDGLQYWIGANDSEQEGYWIWLSDKTPFFDEKKKTSLNKQYQNWGKTTLGSQPNNVLKNGEDEDCVVIRKDGSWYDIGCTKRFAYIICESKAEK